MAVIAVGVMLNGYAQAQKTVTFTTTINPGVLLADIRNPFGQSINNPTLDFGKIINSYDCRTNNTALSAVLGTDEQRIYVDNPKAAFDGWTLTIAAANGASSKWLGVTGAQFDYNDSSGEGCFDGDGDGNGGLMSINSEHAYFNSDCKYCDTKNVFLGSTGTENFSESEQITILRANDQSDIQGSWYITDLEILQTVPAEQDGDTYSIEMVLTATAS